MPENERFGASFSIDVTDLKAGLTTANKLIRESESEFKYAAAGMDDWTKSEDGLNAKIKSLTSVTEIQKEKVRALKEQYKKLIDEGLDPTSDQAIELRTKIKNEETALKSNEAELKKQKEALKNVGDESEEAGEKLEKLGNIAKKAGAVAATAFAAAAAAVGALVKESISNYAEYEQLVGGVETLFKDSADTVQQYANNAYKTAGLSANEYMETVTSFSASLLQSLNGDTAEAAKIADMAITDMSDNANKMGTDMESIQNAYNGFAKSNFTMLDNLKLGYGGTKEEMERLLADATELSGVQYDISSYADIVNAIHVVQTELGLTGTTAQEASTTIQGSISSMQSAWENLLTGLSSEDADIDGLITNLIESIGTVAENLLPKISVALEGVIQMVEKLIPQIPPIISEMLPELITAAMSLISGIVDVLPEIVQGIVDILPDVLEAILEMLPSLLDATVQIIVAIINGVSEMLPDIVQAIIDVVPQLIDSLIEAIPTLLDAAITFLMAIIEAMPTIIDRLLVELPTIIDTIITGLLEALPQLIDASITLLMAIVDAMPTIIDAIIENLPTILDSIITGLLEALPQLLEAAITLFMAIIDAMPTIIAMLWEKMPEIISAIRESFIKAIPSVLQTAGKLLYQIIVAIGQYAAKIPTYMGKIITGMVKGLKNGISRIKTIGEDIIKGLWEGISNMASWIGEKIKGFGDSVLGGIKSFFGINSPSKVMADQVGKNLALGIGKGFTDNIGDVNDQITGAMNFSGSVSGSNGTAKVGGGVVVYQTNNYSQAHSRYELYKTKQTTAAAVRLAMGAV